MDESADYETGRRPAALFLCVGVEQNEICGGRQPHPNRGAVQDHLTGQNPYSISLYTVLVTL